MRAVAATARAGAGTLGATRWQLYRYVMLQR